MLSVIQPQHDPDLADYEMHSHLAPAISRMRDGSDRLVSDIGDRTVWMVNSAAQGGGVAEMMPRLISMLRDLGVDARWVVIGPDEPRFFEVTKHVHNMIHGAGDPHIGSDDRDLYHAVSATLAEEFAGRVKEGDLVVMHDPQPAGMGAMLKDHASVTTIWRSHIGLDEENSQTRAAWEFLRPYVTTYDRAVFTLPEYAPDFLKERQEIIHPAIDPLSDKNRPLRPHRLSGVLANAGLAQTAHPVLTPPFATPAQRLQAEGAFAPVAMGEDIGLLFRPIVTQISRWDRLKGWTPLLKAFVLLKERRSRPNGFSNEHRRRLDLVRLVLAGPEPDSIQDDPEALEVFYEICGLWHDLDPALQRDIAILSLPMSSRKTNALMVNALQRCSTIVVQNSLREGFGLTVTEAMWKASPVIGSRTPGIGAQIKENETGLLVSDPSDSEEVAHVINGLLELDGDREAWGRGAQKCVTENFLVFSQVRRWLEVLSDVAKEAAPADG